MTRLLGAVLAGGRSSRFGGDKALFSIAGERMIDHAIAALTARCDSVAVCGREWPGLIGLVDRPGGQLGPLAGLNAALHYGAANGFAAVLCAPVDVRPLTTALDLLLGTDCAVLSTQWSIGRWPVALAPALDSHLASGERSVHSWIAASGAAMISDSHLHLINCNTAPGNTFSRQGCQQSDQ